MLCLSIIDWTNLESYTAAMNLQVYFVGGTGQRELKLREFFRLPTASTTDKSSSRRAGKKRYMCVYWLPCLSLAQQHTRFSTWNNIDNTYARGWRRNCIPYLPQCQENYLTHRCWFWCWFYILLQSTTVLGVSSSISGITHCLYSLSEHMYWTHPIIVAHKSSTQLLRNVNKTVLRRWGTSTATLRQVARVWFAADQKKGSSSSSFIIHHDHAIADWEGRTQTTPKTSSQQLCKFTTQTEWSIVS